MKFTRYAIFYTPPPGPLARFGSSWLGWDAAEGKHLTAPQTAPLPLPWDEITTNPRKYGFHGTIKPPFTLAGDQNPEALIQTFAAFCRTRRAPSVSGLKLVQLGRFLALVPAGETEELNRLAAETVENFEPFRASLSAAQLARRRQNRLTALQDALLLKWGYPYVMDEFRFHLTLTGKLPKAQAAGVLQVLNPLLDPLLPEPFDIDALSLMGEDEAGMFHLIERLPLEGQS